MDSGSIWKIQPATLLDGLGVGMEGKGVTDNSSTGALARRRADSQLRSRVGLLGSGFVKEVGFVCGQSSMVCLLDVSVEEGAGGWVISRGSSLAWKDSSGVASILTSFKASQPGVKAEKRGKAFLSRGQATWRDFQGKLRQKTMQVWAGR